MHDLCLISLLLLAQAGNGSEQDAALFGGEPFQSPQRRRDKSPGSALQPQSLAESSTPATPLGQFGSGRNAASGANVGQQLQHPQPRPSAGVGNSAAAAPSYVAPAAAVENVDGAPPERTTAGSFSDRAPLPLAKEGNAAQADGGTGRTPPSLGGTIVNIVSSLAIVLGLFFGVAWLMRRNVPQGGGALPSDVVQVLGRAPLAGKQQMYLVRVGEKLVLVSLGAGGAQTLTEVTDAPEVERLSAACEAVRTGSASASFRQVLTQLGSQPAAGGFFGNGGAPANTRNRRHPSRTDGEEAHA